MAGEEEQQQFDQQQDDGFDIEFPSYENQDDISIGKLTDDNSEPPLEASRLDDDTAANTMDTVDLVAEVKRVWRHVQRYEKKKLEKKEKKREYRNRYNNSDNANVDDSGEHNTDGTVNLGCLNEEEDEGGGMPDMGLMMQQFSEMQTMPKSRQNQQQQQHHDGDSKFSDITPSSPPRHAQANDNRGRTSGRPPMTPDDGRLGKHIRSTSAHSRTHTPRECESPGLDSNNALPSQTSTEKDVVFLNESVDEFYDGQQQQGQQKGSQQQRYPRQQRYPTASSSHPQQQYNGNNNHSPSKKALLNKLQRSSPNTLQQYSKSQSNEEEGPPSNHDHLLSAPYDMTKTKSTGTSFTQKTQQVSNTTGIRYPGQQRQPAKPSTVMSEMAHKYIKKQRDAGHSPIRNGITSQNNQQQQQQRNYYQQTQQSQQTQRSSNNDQYHSKAIQNARERRNRVS